MLEERLSNVFISAPNLLLALLILQSGAGGETRQEIAAALGLEDIDERQSAGLGAFVHSILQTSESGARLVAATGLWVDADARLSRAFADRIARSYAAQARAVDLSDPHTADAINQWVSQATAGQIDALLTEADLTRATECILASAISFRGVWQTPFQPELTNRRNFTTASGTSKVMPFMHRSGHYMYAATDEFQAVSVPYRGERLSMEVLLPTEPSNWEGILRSLDLVQWERCLAQLERTQVSLALPQFGLTWTADMRASLAAIGVKRAFGPGADFSLMGLEGRFIGTFKHVSKIRISEEGTEAGAATAVGLIRTAARPVSMLVDRPFFCAIRDRANGCLVFAGIVAEPA